MYMNYKSQSRLQVVEVSLTQSRKAICDLILFDNELKHTEAVRMSCVCVVENSKLYERFVISLQLHFTQAILHVFHSMYSSKML